ncbi:MAG: hypothetical protein NTX59_04250 [Elusimicrobia bacterium]|nr:hypothetical protein [Elusimicrobiota bacterium]
MDPRKTEKIKASGHGSRPALPGRVALWLEGGKWRAAALLAAFTWLLWGRTLGFALHHWDDSVYLFEDSRLDGLTLAHLRDIFTRPFFANYHPVTTLTYLFDRSVWGQWIPGCHITQLVFYAAGVILAYELFRRVLGDRFWALMGAAIFSAHTLHVEPVAWLACRKDVVCMVFYAAALIAYKRYADIRENSRKTGQAWPFREYLFVMFWTCLALGAKGYAAVLPLVFLAYDLCFFPRVGWRGYLDKIPLLGLAAGLVLMTVGAQEGSGALLKDMSVLGGLTASGRIEVLLKIFALYAARSLAPLALNAKYMVSSQGWYPQWVALLGLALLGALVSWFILLRKRAPAAAYSFALFGLPLATTMNTFFTLRIWMTDRYLFLPTLGSCLLLVWAGKTLQEKWPDRKRTRRVTAGVFIVLTMYCGLTLARINVWSSLVLLRSDTLRKNVSFLSGDGPVSAEEFLRKAWGRAVALPILDMLEELAVAYDREGRPGDARPFREILRQVGREGVSTASNAIDEGRPQDAVGPLSAIVEKGEWEAPAAAKGLGDAYSRMNKPEKARNWYHRSFELYKKHGLSGGPSLVGEMTLEFNLRNFPRMIEVLRLLQKESPGDPRGLFFEGRALEEMGQAGQAYLKYELVEKMPDSAFLDTQLSPGDVQRQMGITAQKLGKTEEMRKHFLECLRLNPRDPDRETIERLLKAL